MKYFFYAVTFLAGTLLFFTTCKKEENPPANCPDCPSITTLTPNFGSPGDTITLTGKNFAGLQRVQFGTEEAEVLDGATATTIKVISPDLNKTGAVDVIVVRNFQAPSGGTAVLNSEAVAFTYAPLKPVINSITPNSGIAGATIIITGQRFTGIKAVRFGNTPATTFQVQSATSISATVPDAGVGGPVNVVVVGEFTLGNGTKQELPSEPVSFTYTVSNPIAPEITTITPAQGFAGAVVTINGQYFSNLKSVRFGNAVALVQPGNTATQIKAVAPNAGLVGPVDVIVTTEFTFPNGTKQDLFSTPGQFTFDAPPTITGFSPASGKKDQVITITGSGFGTQPFGTQVYFNEKPASVVSISFFEIKARVPVGCGHGFIKVISNSMTAQSMVKFEYEKTYTVSKLYDLPEEPYDIDFYNNRIIAGSDFPDKFLFSISSGVVTSIPTAVTIRGGGFTPSGDYVFAFGPQYKFSRIPPGSNSILPYQNFTTDAYASTDIEFYNQSNFVIANNPFGSELCDYSNAFGFTCTTTNVQALEIYNQNVYFTDGYTKVFRKNANGQIETIAGSNSYGWEDGPLALAKFNITSGIVIDNEGNIYVVDKQNNCIRYIDLSLSKVKTIAGNSLVFGSSNGDGSVARFANPHGICFDNQGNLLVADSQNSSIRKITIE